MRRFCLCLVILAVMAASPAVAQVSPDDGYGAGGTATVAVQCAAGTVRGMTPQHGYDGRSFFVQECAAGYVRLVGLGNSGEIDSGFGTNGRVTVKVPESCRDGMMHLRPGQDGSLYLILEDQVANVAAPGSVDLHLCLTRITSTGKLVGTFGGGSPVRRLDRAGGGINSFVGAEIDSGGRLVVFTARTPGAGAVPTSFVNRYRLDGKPDGTFDGDGQRSYSTAGQRGTIWGGVVGTRPVVAIGTSYGTLLVRFTSAGNLDRTFAGDGTRSLRSKDVGSARTGQGQVALDAHGRVTVLLVVTGGDGGSGWYDLLRFSSSGVADPGFRDSTARVQAPSGEAIQFADLQLSTGRTVVNWQGENDFFTTGYNGDGTRWQALGPSGTTTEVALPRFARDRAQFYTYAYLGEEHITSVEISRGLVQ